MRDFWFLGIFSEVFHNILHCNVLYREESNKALQIVRGLDGTLQQATANQLLMNAIRLNVSEFEQQIQAVINNVSVLILK